jgi:PIN domain nuclease of toxin-antitoxin system
VNLLLDTHVVLWVLSDGTERIGPTTLAAIRDPRNVVAVSAASIWEVEIKRSLGKLDAPDGFAAECVARGFEELPITFDHAETSARLPPHHHDPFDRMLIGQATIEDFRIVTLDRAFSAYEIGLFDASD